MTTRFARPRAGFTLIEMLIVIGIIAALAAISVGAFFQVRGSQDKSVAEVTLNKLHSAFDIKYKAVLDDARKAVANMADSDPLMVRCGGDKERALVVMTYVKLRNEFPMESKEVNPNPLIAPASVIGVTMYSSLVPRAAFAALYTKLPTDPTGVGEQESRTRAMTSSKLMYVALTQTGGGGTMGGSEGLQQQVGVDPVDGLSFFRDSWGEPIGFFRHAKSVEINQSPYAKPRAGANGVTTSNALDPNAKMFKYAMPPAFLGYFPGNAFSNENSVATFYSAGPNKEFGADPISLTEDEALDNLLSYRLRREGAKGD